MIEFVRQRRTLMEYGFALLTIGVAWLLTVLIPALFAPNPFLLFFGAVTLSAWYGGFGPGFLASLLSLVIVKLFFLPPSDALPFINSVDLTRLAAFCIVTGVVSTLHQQHQRTLTALRRSRDQLDIYLRDMANGITVQDKSGKLIYANYEAAKIMGFVSSDALVNASGEEVLSHFDIFDETGEPFPLTSLPGRLALLGMQYPEVVLRYRFKDTGKERWAYDKARPVFDEKGQVQSAISLFLDITALKNAEQALAGQREQFRVTLRSIGDAVIAADAEGNITFMNPVASMLTGWAEKDALVHPVSDIFRVIDEQSRRQIENPVSQVLEQGQAVDLGDGAVLVSSAGTQRPIEASGTPILDGQNHTVGAVLVFRDITEQRQSQAILRARVLQQEVVAALGLRALSGIDLTLLMQAAAEQLAQTLHVEYANVLELLPPGKTLLLRAGVGWNDGLVGTATVDASKESHSGYTLISNEPVIIKDLRTETRFRGSSLLIDHHVVSGMSVIISGDNGAWGVLGVYSKQKRLFTQDDIHFLQAIANVLGLSIEREVVARAEREERAFAEALRDSAEALGSTLDLAQVLDRILENVEQVVPHASVDVMLIEEGGAHITRSRGYTNHNTTEAVAKFELKLDETPTIREMVATHQPLLINDVRSYADWVRVPETEWQRSYIGAPLMIDGEVKGFLNLTSPEPDFFTQEQAHRLQAFAAQASVAIRNAQLYAAARKNADNNDIR